MCGRAAQQQAVKQEGSQASQSKQASKRASEQASKQTSRGHSRQDSVWMAADLLASLFLSSRLVSPFSLSLSAILAAATVDSRHAAAVPHTRTSAVPLCSTLADWPTAVLTTLFHAVHRALR